MSTTIWTPAPVLGPPVPCPKCGRPDGFSDVSPKYHDNRGWMHRGSWTDHGGDEHLDWHCQHCGYVVETPTAEQKASQ